MAFQSKAFQIIIFLNTGVSCLSILIYYLQIFMGDGQEIQAIFYNNNYDFMLDSRSRSRDP